MGRCAQEGYDQDISEHPLWLQREKCISGATAGSGTPSVLRLEQGVRRADCEAGWRAGKGRWRAKGMCYSEKPQGRTPGAWTRGERGSQAGLRK